MKVVIDIPEELYKEYSGMTRKEAIKILLNTVWVGTEQDDVETAVYMVAEALE